MQPCKLAVLQLTDPELGIFRSGSAIDRPGSLSPCEFIVIYALTTFWNGRRACRWVSGVVSFLLFTLTYVNDFHISET